MPENVLESLLIDIKTIGVALAGSEIDRLSGHVRRADKEAGKARGSHVELGKAFGGVRSAAGHAAGAIGAGGMAGVFGESIKNAMQMQRSQAQLGNAITRNVHEPAEGATEQLSKFGDAMSVKGGFMPWQNVGAMSQFVRITHSTTAATKDLSLATDIARGTHRGFNQAVKAVMLVENGRASSLRRLGIAVPTVTTAQDKLRDSHVQVTSAMRRRAKEEDAQATKIQALTELHKRFGGATATFSKTAEGAMSNFRNATEVLSTHLGAVFLPLITKVFNALSKFVGQMMAGKGAGGTFVNVIKGIVLVLGTLARGFIGVIVLIINFVKWCIQAGKTIVSAFKAAYNWFQTATTNVNNWLKAAVRNTVNFIVGLWRGLRNAIGAVWTWLRNAATAVAHWIVARFNDVRKGVGSVWTWLRNAATGAKNWIVARFNDIKNLAIQAFTNIRTNATNAFTWIKTRATDVKTWVTQRFTDIVNFVKSLPGKITAAAKGLWDGLKSGLVSVINWVIDKMNAIPFIHGGHIGPIHIPGIPTIPHVGMQAGGWVQRRGTYLVGERGPELVHVPGGAYVTPNDRIAAAAGGAPAPGWGDRPLVIYNVLDGKIVSKSVVRQGLLQQSRS